MAKIPTVTIVWREMLDGSIHGAPCTTMKALKKEIEKKRHTVAQVWLQDCQFSRDSVRPAVQTSA